MEISCIKHGFYLFISGLKLSFQMMRGACKLSKLRMPIISVFGGREATKENPYYAQAFQLSKRCAQERISVLTGGGPGLMYAANCGAKEGKPADEKKLNTLGIGVLGIDERFKNVCSPLFWVSSFLIRKWLLIRYSLAIVVFPGGLGTADELFDVLNYMKHGRVPGIPLILIGVSYWKPILTWMKENALSQGFIKPEYMHFLHLTDDLDDALRRIKHVCDQYRKHVG